MRPTFHKVSTPPQISISIRHDVEPHFSTIWHYHPELEVHHVVKGQGTRFVGYNISNFSEGDIIFLGSNLPHTWRCNEEYFKKGKDLNAEAIIIQFMPDCFGKDFLRIPETQKIIQLYEKAKKGMKITGKTRTALLPLIYSAVNAKDLDKIIILLSIIKSIAETDEYESITSDPFGYINDKEDMDRINKIYSFTLQNYYRKISLEEVASVANFSVTSFCRYFKLMTRKTFYDFLLEIRISNACRLIVADTLSMEEICSECGFNNISNFYRHFKKNIGLTPLEYKKNYQLNKTLS